MKRIIFTTIFFTIFILTITAQDSGRAKWLGGSLSLSGQSNGQNQSSFTLMPELGFFLDNGWSAGARVGFGSTKTKLNTETRTSNTFTIMPFARKNFASAGSFNIFGQGELPLTFNGGTNYDGSSMASTNSIGLRVRPGISYTFNEAWGFQMLMPTVFSFSSSEGASSFRLGVNDGYSLQGYLLDTTIGFIYMF